MGMALTRALLGSKRTSELSELLKRVFRVAGATETDQAQLAEVLGQFGVIHNLRDKIVHQGAWPEFHEGKWAIRNSNHNQIKEQSQLVETYFTIEDLDDMAADLDLIQDKVRRLLFTAIFTHGFHGNRSSQWVQQEPWRYTPSRLKLRRPVSAPKPKARSPRQKPSPE